MGLETLPYRHKATGIGLPFDHPFWARFELPRFCRGYGSDFYNYGWEDGFTEPSIENKPKEKSVISVYYLRMGEKKPLPGKPLYNSDDKPDYHGRWENTGVDDDGVYQPIDRDKPSLEGSRKKEREARLAERRRQDSTAVCWNGKSEWLTVPPVENVEQQMGSSVLDWAKKHLRDRND